MAMIHGGQLSRVAKQFNISKEQWLDLSTGIAPFSYEIPNIPLKVWQDLPTIPNTLIEAAKTYYQAEYCWPVAGSQALIEKLPRLWNDIKGIGNKTNSAQTKHAYLPKVGYKEHQQAWSKAGYQLHFYQQKLPTDIQENSVVVVINPNNPLTDVFSIEQMLKLQNHCAQKQALLIIDEAFADIFEPAFSFTPYILSSDVLVLRSFGKFFGLAGIRIGFVCSNQEWNNLLQEESGPWAVNGPALFIAEQALKDTQWQLTQKQKLQKQSETMQVLLKQYLPVIRIEANNLFITVFLDNASSVYQQLCQSAIYVRLTDESNALRFGIADSEQLRQLSLKLQQSRLSAACISN